MNNNERPNINPNFPQGRGSQKSPKNKKRVVGVVGGAALAAALAFGGGAALSQTGTSFAQTNPAPTTAAATPSTGSGTSAGTSAATPSTTTTGGTSTAAAASSFKGGRGGELGDKGGARGGVSGTISAINGSTITLTRGSVIVIQATLNANTVYIKAGQTIALADLKVGQQVSVQTTTATDGTVSVSAVQVILSQSGGTVSAVDASSLTLTKSDNSTVKVNLSSATTYSDLGKSISLADIKSGIKVEVAGTTNADGSLNAEVVTVEHDRLSGSVTAVSGNTITVQVNGKGGKNDTDAAAGTATGTATATPSTGTTTTTATVTTKTITVSGSTVYLEGGQSVALSEIAVGSSISAQGTLSSDGSSLTALQVQIQLPHYQGQVTSVSGNTIVITDRSGASKTIDVSSTTTYMNGQATAALSNVTVGATISAEGKVDSAGKMTASQIQIGADLGKGGEGHGKGGR